MSELTPKQEAFARFYVELGNASEAYRRAYNAENMGQPSIAVEACNLLSEPKIALTVQRLRDEIRDQFLLTAGDLIRELEEARAAALHQERPQAAAMVAATMGKAKILGLEAPQKVAHTDAEGNPITIMPMRIELVGREDKD